MWGGGGGLKGKKEADMLYFLQEMELSFYTFFSLINFPPNRRTASSVENWTGVRSEAVLMLL